LVASALVWALAIPHALMSSAGGGASPSAGAGASALALESDLVVNSCGGRFGEAVQAAFTAPFQAATGVNVIYDSDCDLQTTKLASQAEAGQVQWDVVTGFGGPFYEDVYNSGLLLELDHDALGSNAADLLEGAIKPYGLGFHADTLVLGYIDTDFPDAKPTIDGFFDPVAFPQPRGMSAGGFEDWARLSLALVADGVPREDLTPLDYDRAFAKLDAIKPLISNFYRGGSAAIQMMVDHTASMCICADVLMSVAQKVNPDVRIAVDGALSSLIYWAIPKAAPHPNAAMAFLKSTLDPGANADWMNLTGSSSLNRAAYELIPPSLLEKLVLGPSNIDKTWQFTAEDNEWFAEHATEIADRWATWVGQ
jgi:spermidine/putrescine-binding protein